VRTFCPVPPAGSSSGLSPGYGLTLVAETTSGCLICAESAASTGGELHEAQGSAPEGGEGDEPLLVPEDIGKAAAQALLEEIQRWVAA
jgi:RNA 3'-terminal phosphate cyclase-like protein